MATVLHHTGSLRVILRDMRGGGYVVKCVGKKVRGVVKTDSQVRG